MAPEAAPSAAVKRTIRVNVPIEKAFQVFTERIGSWWPASHHIAPQPFHDVVIEPRAGGRWFERDVNGAECDWGRVLAWDPPYRRTLSWHLQPDFKYSPDPALASEVALEFIAEGKKATRLELEHRHIERHGDGWENLRKGVDAPDGWTGVLEQYIAAAK